MLENIATQLKQIAKRIEDIFKLLDSLENKAISNDIFTHINNRLHVEVDRLYHVLQQCYDECLYYLEDQNVDIHEIDKIPQEYRETLKKVIYPFWKSFQHSINKLLMKYLRYLSHLDQDIVAELRSIISMDEKDLLNIFDNMLKSVAIKGFKDDGH